MEVSIKREESTDVVKVAGRIAASESMDLTRQLEAHFGDGASRPLLLDLGGVDYMSSAGLGTLVWLAKRMREAKQGFAIIGLRDRVAHVFKLSGLDRILPIHEDRAAADAAIAQQASGGVRL